MPEYVNDRGLETLFGIPPSTGYRLADAGLIRFIYIREEGRKCGQRLWDCSFCPTISRGIQPAATRQGGSGNQRNLEAK